MSSMSNLSQAIWELAKRGLEVERQQKKDGNDCESEPSLSESNHPNGDDRSIVHHD